MAKEIVKTKIDVAVLQVQVQGIEKSVNTILTNHLPHLSEDIQNLNDKFEKKTDEIRETNRVLAVKVAMIVGIISLIAEVIVAKIIK